MATSEKRYGHDGILITMIDMQLLGLRVEPPSNTPIVLLQETTGIGRILPIFIGGAEATAIAFALEGVHPPRPLTHDLLKVVIETFSATMARLVLTEIRDGTYYADMDLSTPNGAMVVSCRPSDGIALALRCGAPIVATEALLDEAGHLPELDHAEVEAEEVVEQFKDFIEHVDPEDFAS